MRMPPPCGNDIEVALMAQGEAIQKTIRTASSMAVVVSIYYFA
jgi:hypothetical protein